MHRYTIETDRLLLRPLTEDDAGAVFAWVSDPQVNRYMIYTRHTDVEQTREWLRSIQPDEDNLEFGFVRRADGLLIGSGGTRPNGDGTWELGYNLRRDCWGQGYATEAARAILELAHRERGVKVFTAGHAVDNPASGRVMEKCGMVFDHFGEYSKQDGSEVFPAKYYRLEVE